MKRKLLLATLVALFAGGWAWDDGANAQPQPPFIPDYTHTKAGHSTPIVVSGRFAADLVRMSWEPGGDYRADQASGVYELAHGYIDTNHVDPGFTIPSSHHSKPPKPKFPVHVRKTRP